MSNIDYDIKIQCPNCGEVHIRSKNFLSASYDKSGWISVSFGCPTCDAAVELKSNLGTQIATELSTQLVSKMTSVFVNTKPNNDAENILEQDRAADAAEHTEQTQQTEQNPSPDSSSEAQQAKQAKEDKVPLNISYMAVGNNPMMTFGVQLEPKGEAPSANKKPTTPSEEDKARIEYFHRQIESLDTVDDAIDEIETGYHLRDQDEDDE